MRRLDTTQLTIHSDIIERRETVRGECCEPVCQKVTDEKRSFIISAATECLEPGTFYTLQIDREVPIAQVEGLDTYIFVEKCGFFRGEVGLNYTTAKRHVRCGEHIGLTGEHETLESVEIDGGEHMDGFDGGCETHGCIPDNPAFPGTDFVGCGYSRKNGVLVPVVLDLLGDVANARNFSTGRFKNPGTGRPYSNTFTLFYNNAGKFVLSRNFRRRSDFA
jgi:hypothetical protein